MAADPVPCAGVEELLLLLDVHILGVNHAIILLASALGPGVGLLLHPLLPDRPGRRGLVHRLGQFVAGSL